LFSDQNDPLSLKPNPDNFVDNKVRASYIFLAIYCFVFKAGCCNKTLGNQVLSVIYSSLRQEWLWLIGRWEVRQCCKKLYFISDKKNKQKTSRS